MTNSNSPHYEVLSPWAEADPIPPRGIAPRIDTLEGKKIGLLRNSKRAAAPLMEVIRNRLKDRYSTVRFSEFANMRPNERLLDQDLKDEFEEWLKGVDAVITTFGD